MKSSRGMRRHRGCRPPNPPLRTRRPPPRRIFRASPCLRTEEQLVNPKVRQLVELRELVLRLLRLERAQARSSTSRCAAARARPALGSSAKRFSHASSVFISSFAWWYLSMAFRSAVSVTLKTTPSACSSAAACRARGRLQPKTDVDGRFVVLRTVSHSDGLERVDDICVADARPDMAQHTKMGWNGFSVPCADW